MNDGSESHRESRPGTASEDAAGRNALDWPRHTGTTAAVLREMEAQLRLRRRRRRRQQFRGLAGAVIALLIVGWAWPMRPKSAPASSVAVSAPTRQDLPDGSRALLRAGAEMRVNFSDAVRTVELNRGEAHFEVTKDPKRPFVVRAGGMVIRAVGTAFAVSLNQTAVEILVTEGRVAVVRPELNSAAVATDAGQASDENSATSAEVLAFVDAGNRVSVAMAARPVAPQVLAVTDAEIDARLAWRVPKLQFFRTPLAEVVPMVNRHSHLRLVLEGAGLDAVRLSGTIRADNVSALLQLLAADYGIEAERRGENEIVLSRAP